LVHGEGELGNSAGRHYVLIEGTDARVHLVYYSRALEEARIHLAGTMPAFVKLDSI
jgi:hypothetical protein